MESESLKSASQQQTQQLQREANALAQERGEPLPYPNVWDFLDPTKLPEGASAEEISNRYREFCKICAPRPRKEYTI